MIMLRRLIVALFAVLALAGITFVPLAKASTSACLGATGCGTNVNLADSLAWNVLNGSATLNNALIADLNTNNQSSDFIRTQPVSGQFHYQYAPNNVASGFCASDPDAQVYNSNPHTIVLRTCNTGNWQLFRVVGSTLVDVATSLPVKDFGSGVPLAGTSGATTAWTWTDGTSNGQMPAPPGYTTKVFEDQFTGTALDTSKWVTYVGEKGIRWDNHGGLPSPYSGCNMPGGTCAAMYAPSQVSVNNGLTLTAQRNTTQYAGTYPWMSGIVNTEGKFSLPTDRAWYVQVKRQIPDTSQGMWPSMWFLPGVPFGSDNELDGLEGGFHELSGVPANQTIHYDYFANNGQHASEQNIGLDMSAGYHTFGVEFKPNQSITYYFDGVQKFQVTTAGGTAITPEPYEIMLNLQVANSSTCCWHTQYNANTPTMTDHIAEVQAWTP